MGRPELEDLGRRFLELAEDSPDDAVAYLKSRYPSLIGLDGEALERLFDLVRRAEEIEEALSHRQVRLSDRTGLPQAL